MQPTVGIVWPEPISTDDLGEITQFTPPNIKVEAVAVEPAPDLSGGITLDHVLSIAADPLRRRQRAPGRDHLPVAAASRPGRRAADAV